MMIQVALSTFLAVVEFSITQTGRSAVIDLRVSDVYTQLFPSASVPPQGPSHKRGTHTSEDPVSRSTSKYCGGVPYPTRLRYSRSPRTLAAPTSPTIAHVSYKLSYPTDSGNLPLPFITASELTSSLGTSAPHFLRARAYAAGPLGT